MFRIGAITSELSPSWTAALDLAVELGILDVEIHTFQDRCIELVSMDEARQIRQELQVRQLKVCNISSTIFLRCHLDPGRADPIPRFAYRSLAGTYKEHLDALRRALAISQVLESPALRVFGFWKTGELTPDTYARAADQLAKPVQMAKEMGVPLVLENCPHTWFDWGERAIELIELVDSPWLQMLWDPCAAVRNGEADIFAAAPRILRGLAHVHAKDLRFDPRSPRGHHYVPVGQGQVDWKGILRRLIDGGFEGVVAIETHHLGDDGRRETASRATHRGLAGLLADCLETRNEPDQVGMPVAGERSTSVT